MCALKFISIFWVVPAMMMVTVSFFVLVIAHKLDAKNLKTFGYIIAVLLWLSAALVLCKGRHHMMAMHDMMKEGSQAQCPMMNR